MKTIKILVIFCMFLLLCGCGALPETGPLGTIESASMASERDGVVYFLDPVGCVEENTGISAYDTKTGAYSTVISLEGEDIKSFQLSEDTVYYRTEAAIYAMTGEEETLLYQETEENWTLDWMFLLEQDIYLSRSTLWMDENDDLTECMQILSVPAGGGTPTVVADLSDNLFSLDTITCYYDGKLYSRGFYGEIYIFDLKTGLLETQLADDFAAQIFATKDGVRYTQTDESGTTVYRLDGTEYASGLEGTLLGGGENGLFFYASKYLDGSVYALRDGEVSLIYDDFEWDMVTEPVGFAAGEHVLFYSPEALTEDAKEENLYHNLYLLHGTTGEIKCIGGYAQDYLYS